MKKIVKKIKKNHELSLELYNTGNTDAMYLAGLIADEDKMTKKILNDWAKKAYYYGLSEYTVAWITSESKFGYELGLKWIKSKDEKIVSAGWATLANYISIKDDSELDINKLSELLDHVEKEIHNAPNRVRYTMNGYVLAAGSYVKKLTSKSISIGNKIGKVSVDMGGTACKVPYIPEYIDKVKMRGSIGKKRKMARC